MKPKPRSILPSPKLERLARQPRMTIAAGFLCRDGILLCTDSLETDGVTKRLTNKVWGYQVSEDWGIAIASAGESDLAESFNESLPDVLGNEAFDEATIL